MKKAISYLDDETTFHPAMVKDKAASLIKTFASSSFLPQATDDRNEHREKPVALSVSSGSPQEDTTMERRRAAASHLYGDEQYVVNLFQVCGQCTQRQAVASRLTSMMMRFKCLSDTYVCLTRFCPILSRWSHSSTQRCKPSVVHIACISSSSHPGGGSRSLPAAPYMMSPPPSLDPEAVPSNFGSGFIWDTEGYIVTNYHVRHCYY